MTKDYFVYHRFDLVRKNRDNINPRKARCLERELAKTGLIVLNSSRSTNGVRDSILIGGKISQHPAERFNEIIMDLDLPYHLGENYSKL
jgi:hypothetical protein